MKTNYPKLPRGKSNLGVRPPWLKVRTPTAGRILELDKLVVSEKLHTVCESAACPNRGECWNRGTATFMILGNICTRSCGFCNVKTGRPTELDLDEPQRVADSVLKMKLKFAVVTSVDRDELADGGASVWAATIRAIRNTTPKCGIEVLIPDFEGNTAAQDTVFDERPDILNHNMETVLRLYTPVRPQGDYQQSLTLLKRAKDQGLRTKSGLMVGLGETNDEVLELLNDLRTHDVDIITIGQYLQPTPKLLQMDRYVTPDEFAMFKEAGLKMGFRQVDSGPLVRSSYHAEESMDMDSPI